MLAKLYRYRGNAHCKIALRENSFRIGDHHLFILGLANRVFRFLNFYLAVAESRVIDMGEFFGHRALCKSA